MTPVFREIPWIFFVCIALLVTAAARSADAPTQIAAYQPFFVNYAPYAESLWHDLGDRGYWGDGLAGGNGGIRGSSNLTLVMAWLVYAYDHNWLSAEQQTELARAGLSRGTCLRRIHQSWKYLADCHITGGGSSAADNKQWGRSWQSPLWVGASGLAALLVWEQLDGEVRKLVERVIVNEADAKIGIAPRDAKPGNTAAEENGWDTHAPAIAAALLPGHPHAAAWLRAAELLAVNTYSMQSDRTSSARIGNERLSDLVSTTNLANDFTLDNHGFFHPSYVKVSGQELGEAWEMLALGDRLHGTRLAEQFRPYGMHHVADVWHIVLRPILLPEGEFAFPSGQDWNLHSGTVQSYFAFIATALGDSVASLAERQGIRVARLQMEASPNARIFGQGDLEWWWEPILLKRDVTAMLHFVLSPTAAPQPAPVSTLLDRSQYTHFPDARIIVCRTPRYVTSLSLRKTPMALIIPLGEQHMQHPYVTTPRTGSILPPGEVVDYAEHHHARGHAVIMTYGDGTQAASVMLSNVVLWISNAPLSPVAIQNDRVVTGGGRTVRFATGSRHVPPLEPMPTFGVSGKWLTVDDQLGLINSEGFDYEPAGKLNRRSAAEDLINPRPGKDRTCLVAAPRYDAENTSAMARSFSVVIKEEATAVVLRDGPDGPLLRMRIGLSSLIKPVIPVEFKVDGQVSERSGLGNLTDGDPSTWCTVRNRQGKGPTVADPIAVEFRQPTSEIEIGAISVVPRPGYGPRQVALQVKQGADWQTVAVASMKDAAAILSCPPARGARTFRLMVTSGWDRGSAASQPRNTQIAELSFLPAQSSLPSASSVAFELETIPEK
jgi:hypothetical protein